MNILGILLDGGPVVYGVIMFVGIWVMWWKLNTGRWYSLFIDVGVFTLVFMLHGGSMAGGFAAMIAALLAGLVFPLWPKRG